MKEKDLKQLIKTRKKYAKKMFNKWKPVIEAGGDIKHPKEMAMVLENIQRDIIEEDNSLGIGTSKKFDAQFVVPEVMKLSKTLTWNISNVYTMEAPVGWLIIDEEVRDTLASKSRMTKTKLSTEFIGDIKTIHNIDATHELAHIVSRELFHEEDLYTIKNIVEYCETKGKVNEGILASYQDIETILPTYINSICKDHDYIIADVNTCALLELFSKFHPVIYKKNMGSPVEVGSLMGEWDGMEIYRDVFSDDNYILKGNYGDTIYSPYIPLQIRENVDHTDLPDFPSVKEINKAPRMLVVNTRGVHSIDEKNNSLGLLKLKLHYK